MRYVVAGLIVAFSAGAGAQAAVQFPGPVTEARAPNSDMRVFYFDPGENQYQIHEYSLRLEYPGGRSDEIDVFTRSVDVAWSPSGEAFYFTDFIGSNVSDCYVVRPGTDSTRKISLTDVITQGHFPAPAWALQHSSHGYVACDGWLDADKLSFVLSGDSDDAPHGFRYSFTYDLKTGIAKQVVNHPRKRKS